MFVWFKLLGKCIEFNNGFFFLILSNKFPVVTKPHVKQSLSSIIEPEISEQQQLGLL